MPFQLIDPELTFATLDEWRFSVICNFFTTLSGGKRRKIAVGKETHMWSETTVDEGVMRISRLISAGLVSRQNPSAHQTLEVLSR
jgi:hypothetical protein